jgi:hypothetical protein
LDILQVLPELIIYGFIGFPILFAAFLILYYLNRVRPVTDEAVLGNYEFHLIGSGEEIKGLVTLASRHVNESLLNSIRRAAEEGIIEKGNPGWDNISLEDLHAYGVRVGFKRILIVTKGKEIESERYSESEKGLKLTSYGFGTNRKVYALPILAGKSKFWHKIYVIEPLELSTLKIKSSDWECMKAAGELAAVLRPAAEVLEKEMTWSKLKKVMEKRFKQALEVLAEEVDKRQLAELEEALRQIEKEAEKSEFPITLPELNWKRIGIIGGAGAIGYLKGVEWLQPYVQYALEPWHTAVLFAALALIGIYLWERMK